MSEYVVHMYIFKKSLSLSSLELKLSSRHVQRVLVLTYFWSKFAVVKLVWENSDNNANSSTYAMVKNFLAVAKFA